MRVWVCVREWVCLYLCVFACVRACVFVYVCACVWLAATDHWVHIQMRGYGKGLDAWRWNVAFNKNNTDRWKTLTRHASCNLTVLCLCSSETGIYVDIWYACMCTHTHTHTCTHTHTHTHTHEHKYGNVDIHAYTHTCTHMHTRTNTHTHTNTQRQAHTN